MKKDRMKIGFFGLLILTVSLTACGGSEWSRKDQRKLLDRCRAEGGSSSYCKCYLSKAMEQYPNADDVETLDFESAVELSIDCQ